MVRRRKGNELYLCNEQDEIIGEIDRQEAHKNGLWHRCSWVFIFKDVTLEQVLLQKRNPEKDNRTKGARFALSTAGHHDAKIRLKKNEPYVDIYEKVAYIEAGQELFYTDVLPHGLILVKGPYIKNNEPRNRRTNEKNQEHIFLFYGVYPGGLYNPNKPFEGVTYNPAEIVGLKWIDMDNVEKLARDAEKKRSRRKYITPELILAIKSHNQYIRDIDGIDNLRTQLELKIQMEYKRRRVPFYQRVI